MNINKNYTIYHLHTDYSNTITNIDSVTKPQDYIKKAKELGMKAIAFSEHGTIADWVKKKDMVEASGMKYIHGVEAYVTKDLNEKVRDNYHVGLYARNYDGVLEINKMLSRAFNREDGHFYYTPRITFEELLLTSENVIITTACIGGILARNDIELKKRFVEFLIENKERCFLEVQHHQDKSQINHNLNMLLLSRETGLRLIAGTDTHALNERHAKGRKILQRSKNIFFEDEEGWDITVKTYKELFHMYRQQNIFTDEEISEALENTNVLADMVEEFSMDKSFKYPKLVEDGYEVLKKKIMEGILDKHINLYENYQEYIKRIKYELDTYVHQGAVDYLLLDEDIKTYAKNNNVFHGPSRGSVAGSVVAYLIGVTEIDPIKENLNFERFMNKERVSLADIDTDYPPTKREFVKDYIFNKPGLYCADIITFNTVALKGSIRDCARALNIPLDIVNEITSNIEVREEFYRKHYKELFEYVDIINGTIVSMGSHPCGSVVSPITLHDNVGTLTLATSDRPVTMLSMKAIDSLNFVKLDILGLDNIEIINETCKLAGIERLTPDNVPQNEEVWKSIRENTVGIFQWESESASKYIKKLFSDNTIMKIKEVNPNFKYIDLFSVGNGAIRPAGASYREELASGIFRDNGHEALNEFLSPTLGYLVYQEQIIEFLNKFCGFTMGEADTVRRGFAKKTGTEQYIPRIKKGFIDTMEKKYNVHQAEAEQLIISFLQVIEDASDYLFSLNHSQAYSYIGYICAYLRCCYPLEFFTVALNQFAGDMDKTAKLMDYIKQHNVSVEQPTFGKSKASYFCDKETGVIYKGIQSVKFLNSDIADELYAISQEKQYDNFIDLYINTKGVNSRQWEVLIKIGYFREFGSIKKLLCIMKLINEYKKKNYKKEDLGDDEYIALKIFAESETEKMFRNVDNVGLIKFIASKIPNEELPVGIIASYQAEYMGSVSIVVPKADRKECIVLDINTKYTPTLKLYRLQNGEIVDVKVAKKDYFEKPLKAYETIYIASCTPKQKMKKVDNGWIKLDEYNYFVTYYKI